MRLAGQLKLGYYPTPPRVVDLIRKHFNLLTSGAVSVFDPCCGEGLALERFVHGSDAVTYGIELDAARAKEAARRLRVVLHAPYEQVDVSPRSMGVLFLNPPYDDGEGERTEFTFLRGTLEALAPQGVLVYIIPLKRFTAPVAECVASHLSSIKLHRFPDPEYADFGQIVVFGRKLMFPIDGRDAARELLAAAAAPDRILPLPVDVPYSHRYTVPDTGNAVLQLRSHSPQDIVLLAKSSPLWSRVEDLIDPPALGEVGRPPSPLHAGHVGLLLSAGCLNGLVGRGAERHIVVGRPIKHTVETTEVEETNDGSVEVTKRLETFRVTIKMLLPSGAIRRLA